MQMQFKERTREGSSWVGSVLSWVEWRVCDVPLPIVGVFYEVG